MVKRLIANLKIKGIITTTPEEEVNIYQSSPLITPWAKLFSGPKSTGLWEGTIASDGNILAVGHTYAWGAGNSDIILVKLDLEGNLLWAKTYGTSGYNIGDDVITAPNGDIIVLGSNYTYQIVVIRLNSEGNLIWAKQYDLSGSSRDIYVTRVFITQNGDIFVIGHINEYGVDEYDYNIYVLKLDGDTGAINGEYAYGITGEVQMAWGGTLADNNDIIIIGRDSSLGKRTPLIFRINTEGTIIWAKTINITEAYTSEGADAIFNENGDLITVSVAATRNNWDLLVAELNAVTGEINWIKSYLDPIDEEDNIKSVTINGTDILIIGKSIAWSETFADYDIIIYRLTESGDIKWIKRYYGTPYEDYGEKILTDSENGTIAIGSTYNFGDYLSGLVLRIDYNGDAPVTSLQIENVTYTPTIPTYNLCDLNLLYIQPNFTETTIDIIITDIVDNIVISDL